MKQFSMTNKMAFIGTNTGGGVVMYFFRAQHIKNKCKMKIRFFELFLIYVEVFTNKGRNIDQEVEQRNCQHDSDFCNCWMVRLIVD